MLKLRTIILPIEKEYLNRLKKVNNLLLLDTKQGQNLNTIDIINYFKKQGLECIQIIDESDDLQLLKGVRNKFPYLNIIGGGNINSIERGKQFIQAGCDYIVVGKHFVTKPDDIALFSNEFKDKLIVSIDDDETKIYRTNIKTLDFVKQIAKFEIKNIIYVDCARMLKNTGVATKTFSLIQKELKDVSLIYSGGISSLSDIKKLFKLKISGIIVGTALYKNKFNLDQIK